jgi:hypothetical protein
MASGILAALEMPVGANTTIYTGPSGMAQGVTVNICNKNDTDVTIRLFAKGISLEYDTIIRANGTLEKTDISLGGEQSLVGYADSANVDFVVHG